jgi:hypothetical protein
MPGSALPPEQKCKVAELRGIQIAGGTSNGLQTAFVDQSQMSRKVLIDLSLGPCTTAGAPPVKLETRFDIDADWVTASGEKLYDGFTLPYSVLSGGTNLGSGRLVLRRGQDLFGNAGEKYFMLASDVALGIPAATEAATLVIDLSSTKIKSRDPAVSGTFQVPLYVQAGAVQPIKGMVSVRGQ